MQVGSFAWEKIIVDGAATLGVTITGGQLEKISCHAQHLLQWNRKMNLTAITDPYEVALKHYVDSIAICKYLPQSPSEPPKILDIGSGGGFPGLMIKIVFPALRVTLIDASRKKVSFLNHMIRTLKLEEIWALHVRAEDFARQRPHSFAGVVCRAFSDLDKFANLALPFIGITGKIIALKGGNVQNELHSLQNNSKLEVNEVWTYDLPFIQAKRSIVVITPPTA